MGLADPPTGVGRECQKSWRLEPPERAPSRFPGSGLSVLPVYLVPLGSRNVAPFSMPGAMRGEE